MSRLLFISIQLYVVGPEAEQHRGQVGLHFKDPGLRTGQDSRHDFHDDTLCSHEVLQGTGGHFRHGVQG